MSHKKIILSLAFSMLCTLTIAQISIPPIDFQVKSGVGAIMDTRDNNDNPFSYTAPILYGEINWNISQHIALGAFGSAGMYSTSNYKVTYSTGEASYGGTHSLYGIKLRLSTGRAQKFRPFMEMNYGKLQMVLEKDIYRLGSSTTFFGWSTGLMIRAGSRMYIVLPQVNLRFRSSGFFFEIPGGHLFGYNAPFVEVCAGLSYNIGKKK